MTPLHPLPPRSRSRSRSSRSRCRYILLLLLLFVVLFLTLPFSSVSPPQPKDKPHSALVTAAAKTYRKTAKKKSEDFQKAEVKREKKLRDKPPRVSSFFFSFFSSFFFLFVAHPQSLSSSRNPTRNQRLPIERSTGPRRCGPPSPPSYPTMAPTTTSSERSWTSFRCPSPSYCAWPRPPLSSISFNTMSRASHSRPQTRTIFSFSAINPELHPQSWQ